MRKFRKSLIINNTVFGLHMLENDFLLQTFCILLQNTCIFIDILYIDIYSFKQIAILYIGGVLFIFYCNLSLKQKNYGLGLLKNETMSSRDSINLR